MTYVYLNKGVAAARLQPIATPLHCESEAAPFSAGRPNAGVGGAERSGAEEHISRHAALTCSSYNADFGTWSNTCR